MSAAKTKPRPKASPRPKPNAGATRIPAKQLAELRALADHNEVQARLVTYGGYAGSTAARERGVSYIPGLGDPWAPFAFFSDWEPPDPLAFTPAMCAELRACTDRPRDFAREPWRAEHWDVLDEDLTPETLHAVRTLVSSANTMWWRLDLTGITMGVKRYSVGHAHPEHVDLHPGPSQGRKLAFSVQLSPPDAYKGGGLLLRVGGADQQLLAPDALGSATGFPGWQQHQVEPVTAGERWALIIDAYGPPPR